MGRIHDESPAPVECRITFTWPSSVTREQLDALNDDVARTEFMRMLHDHIHNDLPGIVAELIAEERYEVDVREVPRTT